MDTRSKERLATLAISVVLAVLALPLIALSCFLSVTVVRELPGSRGDFFLLSIVLTFALFFAVMAWKGFASIRNTGPALTVRGWRLLAAAFVLVAAMGTIGHWFGAVLPLVVAAVCLYNDPAVARVFRRIFW